ncbi:hypothetical protein LZF95_06605 [Algoriphagus sp. AGSA1]|uniref:YncE family protein n=1 Tax=Algoriphagus sp. AGSA1 TaxID=2907213 RepID=UPI001F39988B|nr:hypothetical protein [Algoriphagus sp. AGSA1]MCE7054338.1 hypothetical protein [Algoriphagus sp. AGSA1]
MISLILPFLIGLFSFVNPKEIVVEHLYLDRINATAIADQVQTFDLKKDYINIRHMVISKDSYLISPGEEKSKGFATSIAKLDKSGNYINEIYRSKEGSLIQDIAYDPSKNTVFVAHNDRIITINLTNNSIIKEVKFDKSIHGAKIFNNKLYLASLATSDKSKSYFLESYDPSSLKLIKIEKEMRYKAENNKYFYASRFPTLSTSNNNLLLSMGEVNEIYSSNDGFQDPTISFKNIYKNRPTDGDIIFSLRQGMVGKFVTTGFRYRNNQYVYFYDQKTNQQFLSKTGISSGVYDDVTNSGYYTPFFTNSNDYMFSYKRHNSNDQKISVLLFKIKS